MKIRFKKNGGSTLYINSEEDPLGQLLEMVDILFYTVEHSHHDLTRYLNSLVARTAGIPTHHSLSALWCHPPTPPPPRSSLGGRGGAVRGGSTLRFKP